MSQMKSLLVKASHYFVGNGLSMLSGLISYPVFTRVLGSESYGLMGLVSSVMLCTVALAKLGVQNSIVRFHAEAQKEGTLKDLASTYMTYGLAVGGLVAALQALAALGLGAQGGSEASLALVLLITAPLVLVRALSSFGMNFIRAEEKTRTYNALDVGVRYLSLGLALLFVVSLQMGVEGFFVGISLAEGVVLAAVLWVTWKITRFSVRKPNPGILRQALVFGFPLLAFELTNIVLSFGDRVLILNFLDDEALGHYTAAYNLGDTLQKFLMFPIALSIQPVYTRLWSEKGPEETSAFLGRSSAFFFLLICPSIAGVFAVYEPLLLLLAGEEYRTGASVLPMVFAGCVIYGGYSVLGAGLFLYKQTLKMSVIVGLGCVLNLGLNAVLIPLFGVQGAAAATLIACVALAIALGGVSMRLLPIKIAWGYGARVFLMSALMYAAVFWIDCGEPLWTLMARVALGAVVFVGLALGADKEGRRLLREALGRA